MFPVIFSELAKRHEVRISVSLALAMALSACSISTREGLWKMPAPTSPQSTGTLIMLGRENVSEQAQLEQLMVEHNATGRILNQNHGYFEVHGISTDDLQRAFPSATVERNEYFYNLIPKSHRLTQNQLLIRAQASEEVDLQQCKQSTEAPLAVVNVGVGQSILQGSLLRGEAIRVNDQGSKAHAKFPSSLKRAWVLIPPGDSNLSDTISSDPSFSFTPDALGGYQLGLVVQDSRGVCGMRVIEFVLTSNEPFSAVKKPRMITNEDLEKFVHLKDVLAPQAWDRSQGEGVVIAVIDSGVHYNHPDLAPNILLNAYEIPGNNVDDDGNGMVDDELGWDFANNDAFPYDDDGHGTHVAGLAASAVTGVAPRAQILAIKGLNGFGGGDVGSLSGAIFYAVDRGAHIVNCSFGSTAKIFSRLSKAIEYAREKNVFVTVAAGNGDAFNRGFNIDRQMFYPASFDYENMITVAAVDRLGQLTTYSNFGVHNVRIAAPGGTPEEELWSTGFDSVNKAAYAKMAGTSMATPIVSGILALAKSRSVAPTSELAALMEQAGAPAPALTNRVRSGRIVDALSMLDLAEKIETTGPSAAIE